MFFISQQGVGKTRFMGHLYRGCDAFAHVEAEDEDRHGSLNVLFQTVSEKDLQACSLA